MLIHIGIDTVKLDGLGFKPLVSQGDTVTVNQPLIQFDSQKIQENAYDDTVMIVVTNTNATKDVVIEEQQTVKERDSLIFVIY
ncbi:phosphotransferase system IIA component [Staphylococcus cohnii]